MPPVDLESWLSPEWLGSLVVLLLVALAAGAAWSAWRKHRSRRPKEQHAPLYVTLDELGAAGPPHSGPAVVAHGVRMRLALLVVAPVGRGTPAPDLLRLGEVMENLAPGMAAVVATHRPVVRVWPPQLSVRGFAAALFANVRLPGERGKGTPWTTLAGRFTAGERKFLVGLVLRAAGPNSLGERTVEQDHDWLDILRVDGVSSAPS
jgi:hypothetical protein